MKTSLNNTRETEEFLSGTMNADESLQFRFRMLLDPLWRKNVAFQQKTYAIIHAYSRKKMKEEIQAVHDKIFSDPQQALYQERIRELFKNP
jgi:hypothetical protein